MNFLEMMQEGGPLAMVAVAFGFLGAILGMVGVVFGLGGSRAGFGLGIGTLVLAILASGAGIAGTLLGKRQVEAALVMVGNDIDRDLILIVGSREASTAATLGAFGSLLPLLLGAIAALAGALTSAQRQRRQGIDLSATEGQGSETSGRAVLAAVFVGIAALALSGAWVTGHRPPPPTKFNLDPEDRGAWDLARAVDDVERANDPSREPRLDAACSRLEISLKPYWKTNDLRRWPRAFEGIAPSITGWKEASRKCIEAELARSGDGIAMTTDALLDSPLLQDEQLKQRVLVRERTRVDAPPDEGQDDGEVKGALDKNEIQRVIRSQLAEIRYCYEKELTRNPTLEGKLTIALTISPTGAVSSAVEADGPFPDKGVSDCVTKEMSKLKFPAPNGGGIVKVRYPFVFKAGP